MKVMFLDESGDHSLDIIDPQYPVFVLAGVIMDRDAAETELAEKMAAFKSRMFGRSDVVLHTADITRNRGGFERMKEPVFRSEFYSQLNDLIKSLKFQIVACVIRKDEHLKRYGLSALDPYMLSLHVLIERFCFEVGRTVGGGLVVAERRNPTLDHELELAFLNLRVRGTHYLQAAEIERRVAGLTLRAKSENLPGLQVADLVSAPIGRHVIGKKAHEDYRIIETKFRRNWRGEYRGYGLVVLPKP
jgi:hypothetical protein